LAIKDSYSTSKINITGCIFAYNLAYEYGGVIYSRGYINLMNSTFDHNGAGVGKLASTVLVIVLNFCTIIFLNVYCTNSSVDGRHIH
jgi:predicted outer membrane repeat protein